MNAKHTTERERLEKQQREAQEKRDAAIARCLQGNSRDAKKYKKCPICMASVSWDKMQEHTETHLQDEARRDRIKEERTKQSANSKLKEGKSKKKEEVKKKGAYLKQCVH